MRILLIVLSGLLLLIGSCGGFGSSLPFIRVTGEFSFDYALLEDGIVDVIVLNSYMRDVRILISGESQTSGSHTSSWNLRDENGARVPDGLYYIRIILNSDIIDTRMYEVHK